MKLQQQSLLGPQLQHRSLSLGGRLQPRGRQNAALASPGLPRRLSQKEPSRLRPATMKRSLAMRSLTRRQMR